LFVEWRGLTEIQQCQQIFDAVKCLTAKGYKSVGLTYSANQGQTGNVFTAYKYDPKKSNNSFDIGVAKTIAQIHISGSNQANILASLDSVTDDEFRKVFRIIPLSTMKIPGGGVDVDSSIPGDSAQCIQYVEQFLALPNSIILGWCDPFTKKNLLSLSDLKPTELTNINKLVDDAYTLNGSVTTDKIQALFPDAKTGLNTYLDKTKSVVLKNTKTGAEYLAKRKKHINIGGEMAETTTNTRTTYIPLYLKTLVGKWNRDAQQIVDECQTTSPITPPSSTPVKTTTPPSTPPKDDPVLGADAAPSKDATPPFDADGILNGFYTMSDKVWPFKVTKAPNDSYMFTLQGGPSPEIASIFGGHAPGSYFMIPKSDYDNFTGNIFDNIGAVWKIMKGGVEKVVPGNWTKDKIDTPPVVAVTDDRKFVDVVDGLLASNGFTDRRCHIDNIEELKKTDPTLDVLVTEFKPKSNINLGYFEQAYYFCKNMRNSFSFLMSSQPKYADLVNIRKNCFLLMCSDIQSGIDAPKPTSEPPPKPSSLSPESSLQEMIEYYSQDGGDGSDGGPTTDETARFKALNIEREPTEFKVGGKVLLDFDGRFSEGILAAMGQACFFVSALQYLMCNEDFLKIMIEGNCKDNFVESININSELTPLQQTACSSTIINDKSVLKNLLLIFKKWRTKKPFNKNSIEDSTSQPLKELYGIFNLPIAGQSDANEVLTQILKNFECLNNPYVKKFLSNGPTYRYTQTIEYPPVDGKKIEDSISSRLEGYQVVTPPGLDDYLAKEAMQDDTTLKDLIAVNFETSVQDTIDSLSKPTESEYNIPKELLTGVRKEVYDILNSILGFNGAGMISSVDDGKTKTREQTLLGSLYYPIFQMELKKADFTMTQDMLDTFKNLYKKNNSIPLAEIDTMLTTKIIDGIQKIYNDYYGNIKTLSKPTFKDSVEQLKASTENLNSSLLKIKSSIDSMTMEDLRQFIIANIPDISGPNGARKKAITIQEIMLNPRSNKGLSLQVKTKKENTFGKYIMIDFKRTSGESANDEKKPQSKLAYKYNVTINSTINVSSQNYILVGFLYHEGDTTQSGHYVCVKCDSNGNRIIQISDHTLSVYTDKYLGIVDWGRGVTSVIYKRVGEEEPAPAGGPPPADEDDKTALLRKYTDILNPLLNTGFSALKPDSPNLLNTCEEYYTQFANYIKDALLAFGIDVVDVDFSGEIPTDTACEGVTDSNLKKFLKLAASVIAKLLQKIDGYGETFKFVKRKLSMLSDFLIKCNPEADSPTVHALAAALAAAAAAAAEGDAPAAAEGDAPVDDAAAAKPPTPLLDEIKKGITLKKVTTTNIPPKTNAMDDLKAKLVVLREELGEDEPDIVADKVPNLADTILEMKSKVKNAISELEKENKNVEKLFTRASQAISKADALYTTAISNKDVDDYKNANASLDIAVKEAQSVVDAAKKASEYAASTLQLFSEIRENLGGDVDSEVNTLSEKATGFVGTTESNTQKAKKSLFDINKLKSSIENELEKISSSVDAENLKKFPEHIEVLENIVNAIVDGSVMIDDQSLDVEKKLKPFDSVTKSVFQSKGGTIKAYDMDSNTDLLYYMNSIKPVYSCNSTSSPELCKKLDELIKKLKKKIHEDDDADFGGGGHIKKKLIRKKTYRNVSKITNNTSRKRIKLTEVFKAKKSNNKTLRKK